MVQPGLTALSNRTPFAWFDGIVLLALAAIVVMWTVCLRAPRRKPTALGGRLGSSLSIRPRSPPFCTCGFLVRGV